MVQEIKTSDIRFYITELQVSHLLVSNEMAFVNYLFDMYVTYNKKLKPQDLKLLNKLYTDIQIRKGYGQA
jgi:hypothetical protein